jgi:hypothetical protein
VTAFDGMTLIIPPGEHASLQMALRRISREDVENAIATCYDDDPGDGEDGDNGDRHEGFAADGIHVLRVWTMPGPLPSFMHSGVLKVKSVGWMGRRW